MAFVAWPLWARLASVFVVGLFVGSAVNWAVYRLAWNPRAIGPWPPRAPQAKPRHWLDWLPVVGWLGMRRDAALHGPGFWIRPLLLELATAGVFSALYAWETVFEGLLPDFARAVIAIAPQRVIEHHYQCLAHLLLFGWMMAATWIDIDEKTIPDAITLPGTLIGVALMSCFPRALLPYAQFDPMAAVVNIRALWLFAPLNPGGNNWNCLPAFGPPALALGLVCVWFWVFAMLPRTWYARHGIARAARLMIARARREPKSYFLILIGLVASIVVVGFWWQSGNRNGNERLFGLLSSLFGMGFGAALVWMVRVLGKFALNREAMGFGDVTLMAMIGAYLGWQPVVLIFFMAPFVAIIIGLTQYILSGEVEIAYGPYLCLAAMATIIGWVPIWGATDMYFTLGWLLPAMLMVCLSMIPVMLPLVRWLLDMLRREK